jgi:hypothetical protein
MARTTAYEKTAIFLRVCHYLIPESSSVFRQIGAPLLGRTAGAKQVVADPGEPGDRTHSIRGRRIREIFLFVQQRCIFEPIDAVQRK